MTDLKWAPDRLSVRCSVITWSDIAASRTENSRSTSPQYVVDTMRRELVDRLLTLVTLFQYVSGSIWMTSLLLRSIWWQSLCSLDSLSHFRHLADTLIKSRLKVWYQRKWHESNSTENKEKLFCASKKSDFTVLYVDPVSFSLSFCFSVYHGKFLSHPTSSI